MPTLGALLLFQYSVLLGPPPELLPPGAQGSLRHTLAAADTQSLKARRPNPSHSRSHSVIIHVYLIELGFNLAQTAYPILQVLNVALSADKIWKPSLPVAGHSAAAASMQLKPWTRASPTP